VTSLAITTLVVVVTIVTTVMGRRRAGVAVVLRSWLDVWLGRWLVRGVVRWFGSRLDGCDETLKHRRVVRDEPGDL
jgi:hypothetical protein